MGFLIGFPVAAFVAGLVTEKLRLAILPAAGIGAFLGGVVGLYAFGIPGLALMLDKSLSEAALMVTAFLPGDLIKVVLAALITQGIARMRPDALLSRS